MPLLDPLKRIPAGRPVARSVRRAFEQLRPLPRPRYLSNTPKTGSDHILEPYFPPTISTIAESALSREAADYILTLIRKLSPTEETVGQEIYFLWAHGKFDKYWRHADITTVLVAAAMAVRPKTYLEIGVRRGRSSAVIAALSPECAIYGFDLWIEEYANAPNPGPDFVRNELRAVGHTGEATFISGDSRQTVPGFLRQHPDLFFDVITVDGDHSTMGASRDLANVLPRLKVGGIIVFDDIVSAPWLMRVWRWFVKDDDRYRSWEFTDTGAGVGVAVRVS